MSSLSQQQERGMVEEQRALQPHSSPQAQGQADARAHGARQRRKVRDPRPSGACLKNRYDLFIRTIGIARAQANFTLANLAYNFDRLIFHERCAATG